MTEDFFTRCSWLLPSEQQVLRAFGRDALEHWRSQYGGKRLAQTISSRRAQGIDSGFGEQSGKRYRQAMDRLGDYKIYVLPFARDEMTASEVAKERAIPEESVVAIIKASAIILRAVYQE